MYRPKYRWWMFCNRSTALRSMQMGISRHVAVANYPFLPARTININNFKIMRPLRHERPFVKRLPRPRDYTNGPNIVYSGWYVFRSSLSLSVCKICTYTRMCVCVSLVRWYVGTVDKYDVKRISFVFLLFFLIALLFFTLSGFTFTIVTTHGNSLKLFYCNYISSESVYTRKVYKK